MVLRADGGGTSSLTIGTTPISGGANTQVLFNDGGTVGSDAGLVYNKTTDVLTAAGGFRPAANDGAALGSAALAFADLFLANTGTITWTSGAKIAETASGSGSLEVTTNELYISQGNHLGQIVMGQVSGSNFGRIRTDKLALGNRDFSGAPSIVAFGDFTSSFPGLNRNGATLETKVGDNTAYAQHSALIFALVDGITTPAATAGLAKIFVDTADGDLKIIYGDGTTKLIVVDT